MKSGMSWKSVSSSLEKGRIPRLPCLDVIVSALRANQYNNRCCDKHS